MLVGFGGATGTFSLDLSKALLSMSSEIQTSRQGRTILWFTFEQDVVLECVLGPVGTAHVREGDKILEPGNGQKFIFQFVDSSQHLVTLLEKATERRKYLRWQKCLGYQLNYLYCELCC